jgi:hypothetical protein
MIDKPGNYEVNFFGLMEDITPTPENISKFMSIFIDKGLLPSTIKEITPLGQVQRLKFSTQNDDWIILFLNNRISIILTPLVPKETDDLLISFINDSIIFIEKILDFTPRKFNRISLATSGIIRELSINSMESIFNRICNTIPFYKENSPVEWNTRWVGRSKLNNKNYSNEIVNSITSVSRIQGQLVESDALIPMDRIELAFDINTYQKNTDLRFDFTSIKNILPELLLIRNQLLSELEEVVNG